MDILLEYINNDEISIDFLKIKNYISPDIIKYLNIQKKYDKIKMILKYIDLNYKRELIEYILEFMEMEYIYNEMKEYLELYTFKLTNYRYLSKINEKNIELLIKDYKNFEKPFQNYEIVYLKIKNKMNFDYMTEIQNNMNLNIILDLLLKMNEYEKFCNIVKNFSNYNIINLLYDNIDDEFLLNFFKDNYIEITRFGILDVSIFLILRDKFDIFKWFYEKYIENNNNKSYLYKNLLIEIISENKINYLEYLVSRNPKYIIKCINRIDKQKKLYISSLEMYDYMIKYINIEFTLEIFWNIFQNMNHKYDYIKYIENIYPTFNIILEEKYIYLLYNNDDVRILEYFEKRQSKIFTNQLNGLIIYCNNIDIIEWFILNYNEQFNLNDDFLLLMTNKNNLDWLSLLENYYTLTIQQYDILINFATIFGYDIIYNYIISKYKYRYQLILDSVYFDPNENTLIKKFKCEIQYINEFLKMDTHIECTICLDHFDEILKTNCNHTFCNDCIYKWKNNSTIFTCPYCRDIIHSFSKLSIHF